MNNTIEQTTKPLALLFPDDPPIFPPHDWANEYGLLAIGGDLGIERLLAAYSNGIFPWYNEGEIIQWFCPNERFVIFPNAVYVSKSMRKFLNKTDLAVKFNTDFEAIIRNCKTARTEGTWITDDMETAYCRLFAEGYAMCVGVYDNGSLVGGLYGVTIGKCFFGESMFTKTNNASKLALIKLCEKLSAEGFSFIDCQFHTEHLESMGGKSISWEEYSALLSQGFGRQIAAPT